MKQTFKIPVEWTVYDTVEIEAESLEEAIKIFDETIDDIPLPTKPEYLNGTFQRSCVVEPFKDVLEYYKLFQ